MLRYKSINPGRISGKLVASPSKSITHRLLIMSALSGGKCIIRNPLMSEDTRVTLGGLRKLGYEIHEFGKEIICTGIRRQVQGEVMIEVKNSGTSARFLTALAALLPVKCRIDGTAHMRNRPMGELLRALKKLGAEIPDNNGSLPLCIRGGEMTGGRVEIDARQSSQFLSALLLIAPVLQEGLVIVHGGSIVSESYVDMTAALMREAEIEIGSDWGTYDIPGRQRYQISDWTVEGDYSSSAYFMIGAAISGGHLEVSNLNTDSMQGDRQILEILQAAGAKVNWKSSKVHIKGQKILGIDWDMNSCPDLAPTVSVMALFAGGKTRLRDVPHLRYKESDRIHAILKNIKKLGGSAYFEQNDLIIEGCQLRGAVLPSFNDHRIAMSFALAGLRVPKVRIENPDCVNKSYPGFWRHLDRLIHPGSSYQKY